MKIEIDWNGSFAICKLDGRPFNYCDTKDQTFAFGAFRCIEQHWRRERKEVTNGKPKTL